MKTKIIEATNVQAGGINHGKFLIGQFDVEWSRRSHMELSSSPLLRSRGWSHGDVLVLDLETCEGAVFSPHGYAKADLDKHKIWVCPLFEKFLIWLYAQDLSDLDKLPNAVQIDDPESSLQGYRREGKESETT